MEANGAASMGMMIVWMVVIFGIMYFLMIRPQKKEQKRLQTMLNSMEVGDSVVTTSGFYGVVIDMTEEDVIVEFGNNKNCRIDVYKRQDPKRYSNGSSFFIVGTLFTGIFVIPTNHVGVFFSTCQRTFGSRYMCIRGSGRRRYISVSYTHLSIF